MKFLLLIGSLAAIALAGLLYSVSKSAVHEIEVLLLLLIAAVLATGFAVVSSLENVGAVVQMTASLTRKAPGNPPANT